MAAALMLGSAAVAQTTAEEDDTDAAATQSTTTTSTTTTTTTAPAHDMSTMGMAQGQTVAPGNTSPETDARGIPVISAPAVAPAGYNQGARTLPPGSAIPTVAPPAPTAAGPLPPCTRTVTDRCTQTYERGRAR
ncbi:MAG TPA: hypothetical protein VK403_06245 [Allosphingosinicella sp.]|nr:hypothetical protein [Allosphingosinicella sp.]